MSYLLLFDIIVQDIGMNWKMLFVLCLQFCPFHETLIAEYSVYNTEQEKGTEKRQQNRMIPKPADYPYGKIRVFDYTSILTTRIIVQFKCALFFKRSVIGIVHIGSL